MPIKHAHQQTCSSPRCGLCVSLRAVFQVRKLVEVVTGLERAREAERLVLAQQSERLAVLEAEAETAAHRHTAYRGVMARGLQGVSEYLHDGAAPS